MGNINWFEIPVSDFDRAKAFYGAVMAGEIQEQDNMGFKMGFLPGDMTQGVTGAIIKGEGFKPSMEGAVVYLNGGEDLTPMLQRAEAAGGKVLAPKTSIGEWGFIAFIQDTEGNKVGIHSTK